MWVSTWVINGFDLIYDVCGGPELDGPMTITVKGTSVPWPPNLLAQVVVRRFCVVTCDLKNFISKKIVFHFVLGQSKSSVEKRNAQFYVQSCGTAFVIRPGCVVQKNLPLYSGNLGFKQKCFRDGFEKFK